MKCILLSLVIVVFCSCRSLDGTYYESFGEGWGGATYVFNPDGTFTYESHYDVGGEYGQGQYKFRFGRLIFKYDNAEVIPEWSGEILEDTSGNRAPHNIRISVKDMNNEPIIIAKILVLCLPDSLSISHYSDLDGVALLKLPESCDSALIQIVTGYHMKFKSVVPIDSSNSFSVRLKERPHFGCTPVKSGTILRYKVKSFKPDSFFLKHSEIRIEETDDYRTVRRRVRMNTRLIKVQSAE